MLIFPTIISKLKRNDNNVDIAITGIIKKAADLYMSDNPNIYEKKTGSEYCFLVQELIDKEYLEDNFNSINKDIYKNKYILATYNGSFNYKIANKCQYKEFILNGSYPVLNGLTPVVYKNGNWKVADTNEEWYNYSKQEWANAVILDSDVTNKTAGTILDINTQVLAMFVWIPRYEYKIEGTYGTHIDGTLGTAELPGEIKTNFISSATTTATNGYIIHPAFAFGSKNLNGIWVGKFETSHITLSSNTTKNNLECVDVNCTNADGLRILPNVQSLAYNNVSNIFYAGRSMGRSDNPFGIDETIDTHMMKNTEWGAVAYLSQSIYGKYGNTDYVGINKEVDKNTSYNTGGGIDDAYKTNTSQSTTGNISGIYDMNGGLKEYVMTLQYKSGAELVGLNQSYNSGFKGYLNGSTKVESIDGIELANIPEEKYYDKYTTRTIATACNGGMCYGHAFDEILGWYFDSSINAVSNGSPFLLRSGEYRQVDNSGIFYYKNSYGEPSSLNSFRITLLN